MSQWASVKDKPHPDKNGFYKCEGYWFHGKLNKHRALSRNSSDFPNRCGFYIYAVVAQQVEQPTYNRQVAGSSPAGSTITS